VKFSSIFIFIAIANGDDGDWVHWGLDKGNSVSNNAVVGSYDERPLYVTRA
jgi:hypothetical protein